VKASEEVDRLPHDRAKEVHPKIIQNNWHPFPINYETPLKGYFVQSSLEGDSVECPPEGYKYLHEIHSYSFQHPLEG
jgi:hypothetical protein